VLQDFRVIIDLERHTVSRARAMKAKKNRFSCPDSKSMLECQ
jgi:hypothetical protein